MTIVLFIVVLAVLIFAHELGHFIAAKSVGVRVDEFGIGFPPRLYSWKPEKSETTYSINWIPFGGFVKLFKEDEDTTALSPEDFQRTLNARKWYHKVWVLVAGVFFNVLLAWGLITIGLIMGLPMSANPDTPGLVGETTITILEVQKDSPAFEAGLMPGDMILTLYDGDETLSGENTSLETVQEYIGKNDGKELTLVLDRSGVREEILVTPELLLDENRGVIGVVLESIGTVKLPFLSAVIEGIKTTGLALWNVSVGLAHFIGDIFVGDADFSQVAGPVGIVGLAGDAARAGLVTLISFAAVLSLHLAVINLIPFPALDGGRILFVLIETIKRSPIKPSVANTLNIVGFALLILLMVVVTFNDIVRLF